MASYNKILSLEFFTETTKQCSNDTALKVDCDFCDFPFEEACEKGILEIFFH